MYVPKHMCKNNHSCFIQNGQGTEISINCKGKKYVVYLHNRIPQWCKRTMADAYNNMDGNQMHKNVSLDSIFAKFQDQQELINGNISQSSGRSLSEWLLISKRTHRNPGRVLALFCFLICMVVIRTRAHVKIHWAVLYTGNDTFLYFA